MNTSRARQHRFSAANGPGRGHRRQSNLLFQMGASALVIAFTLIALTSWYLWHSYNLAVTRSQINTQNLTQALSQHANDTFVQSEAILTELVALVEKSPTDTAGLAVLQQVFRQKTSEQPQIHSLYLYNAAGKMIVTANQNLPANTDYADREYYLYHRDNTSTAIHIGKVIRSRITGELILPISLRVEHPDGRFAGVLLESVVIDYFKNFYTRFVISDDSTLMMMLNNGTVLYHQPYNEKLIGTNISNTPLYKNNIRSRSSGIVTTSMDSEKEEKVYSYVHLPSFPVVVTAGLSLDQAFIDWKRDALSHIAMVLIILTVIGLLGVVLTRQVRARMQVEETLRLTQSELRKTNATLEQMARRDSLTGLYNRRHFDLQLLSEFTRGAQESCPLGLILIDIDFFKQYNDIYGHVAGDECLRRVGKALGSVPLRLRDVVARYGGEEFIILLPNTDAEGAMVVAERAMAEVAQLAIPHQASPAGRLTMSIGVFVGLPGTQWETPSKMITRADMALYQAKHAGRDRICVA